MLQDVCDAPASRSHPPHPGVQSAASPQPPTLRGSGAFSLGPWPPGASGARAQPPVSRGGAHPHSSQPGQRG